MEIQLNDQEKEIVRMLGEEGLSVKEISELTGIKNKRTVEKKIERMIKRFKLLNSKQLIHRVTKQGVI